VAKARRDGRSEWDVEREAGEEFRRLNPQPQKAAKPEKIEPMPAGLVQHMGQGGIWLILSDRQHRSDQPVTELTIVLGEHVTQVLLPLRHLEALQMEVTRAMDDHRLAQQRWQAGVDIDAAHEDAMRDWNAAKDAFEKQAVHVWKHGPAEKVEPGQATINLEAFKRDEPGTVPSAAPQADEGSQGDALHS